MDQRKGNLPEVVDSHIETTSLIPSSGDSHNTSHTSGIVSFFRTRIDRLIPLSYDEITSKVGLYLSDTVATASKAAIDFYHTRIDELIQLTDRALDTRALKYVSRTIVTTSTVTKEFATTHINQLIRLTDGVIVSKVGRYIPAAILATLLVTNTNHRENEYLSITQNLSSQLDKQLAEAIYPIQGRIQAYDQILLGIHGLFDSSKTITREEFKSFMDSLNMSKNFPEVPATSVSFKIAKDQIGKHIAEIRKEGFLDYGLNFNLTQQVFVPVVLIEPFAGKNLHVFGYDNFLNPTRKAIMEQAQKEDEPILSSPICLVQEKDGKTNSSFLMFHPLYGKKVTHITDRERKENILGWSAIAFRFPDLISQVSQNRFSDIDLRIYDGKEEDENMLLFNSVTKEKIGSRFGMKKIKTLNINGRDWTFVVRSTSELENSMHYHERLDNAMQGYGMAFIWTLLSYIIIRTRRESLDTIKKITELATHDKLTGLLNRVGFFEGLEVSISHANRNNTMVALMFIDLDGFKIINDSLGHDVGDELLRQVTARMQQCIRTEDIIGRYGGDEFLVAFSDLKNTDFAATVALKLIDALAMQFKIAGEEIFITQSIGISVYPNNTRDIVTLQKYADIAMYKVKNNGKNSYSFFSEGMQKSSEEYHLITTALHHAIERDEFTMAYQPIVEVSNGKIAGMEALLRWEHPELGPISPAKFIPIAEADSETIISIGKWTIRSVCEQIALWKKTGIEVPRITINLSARQFSSKELTSDIFNILNETGISPNEIGFEITEGTLFKDINSAVAIISHFSDSGFEISIDDFGTGYSNLNYLQKFKVIKLKIDRSFILEINTEKGESMVSGIIAFAHSIGMKVVAEGVENKEVVDKLRKYGCDYIQGYHYGKPENAEKIFPRLVSTNVTSIIDGNKEI